MFDLISIVVTGRNDADSLRALLRRLKRLTVTHETLYFDLGSDDGSVQAALEGADRVYRVEDVSGSRSAGRWAGAKLAEFDWLLFLDADMQIQDEFIDFLNNRTYMRPVQGVKAFVGSYHLVENGVRSSRNLLPNVAGSRRARFGGALLVQTEALMAAGQCNMCYNLLDYIHDIENKPVNLNDNHKLIIGFKEQLMQAWEKFKKDPQWLVNSMVK